MTARQLASILLLLCGLMMITSHLPYAYAADEGGDSGDDSGGGDSGSNDGGGDSGGDSGGGGDSGDSNDGDGGKETKQGSSSSNNEGKDDGEEQTDAEDNAGDKAADDNGMNNQEPKNRDDLKGSPEEQEQAAIDDYINEEPGIKKPYPPVVNEKPIVKEPWVKNPTPRYEGNHPIPHKPYPGKGEGNWCKSHPGKCGDGGDDDHPKHDWCKWHKCEHHGHGDHDHHHNHDHNYHNDHHYHNHNDNKYYYYYNNDYSDNHATVILQLDYHGSNNHDDIRLEIGNDFDTVVNFAGEPEDLVVSNLDIDEGENFDVCMENLDSNKVNCVKTHLEDEDKAVYVDLRVPA